MSHSAAVDGRQLEIIVDLLVDLGGLRADAAGARRRLGEGLCALVNARDVAVLDFADWGELERVSMAGMSVAGDVPSEVEKLWLAGVMSKDPRKDMYVPAIHGRAAAHGAALRHDVFSRPEWERSTQSELARACRIGEELVGWAVGGDGHMLGVAAHVDLGGERFTDRDRAAMGVLMGELSRLTTAGRLCFVESGAGGAGGVGVGGLGGLSRRERDVMGLLCAGRSVKEAARELGISTHTAGGYAKSLYRKLGVSNRAELVRVGLMPPAD